MVTSKKSTQGVQKVVVVQRGGGAPGCDQEVVRLELRLTLDPQLEQMLIGYFDPPEEEFVPVATANTNMMRGG